MSSHSGEASCKLLYSIHLYLTFSRAGAVLAGRKRVYDTQMHNRNESEMSDAKQQMDKEYEQLRASADVQLKALEQQHERDREALRRTGAGEEARMQRGLLPKHETEMRQQQQLLKKEYERVKESFKKVN